MLGSIVFAWLHPRLGIELAQRGAQSGILSSIVVFGVKEFFW